MGFWQESDSPAVAVPMVPRSRSCRRVSISDEAAATPAQAMIHVGRRDGASIVGRRDGHSCTSLSACAYRLSGRV